MPDDIAEIVRKLGAAQKRGILALSDDFGPSGEHAAMKRLWHRDDIPMLVDHQHCADDSWSLRPLGLAVRARLTEGAEHG